MIEKIKKQKCLIRKQNAEIKKFKNQVYNAVQYIQDYDALKEELGKMHCKEVREVEINHDIFMEYDSQLGYLEKSVNMLKKNLEKDAEIHKQDNIRIMKSNVKLIREINRLRREGKVYKTSNTDWFMLQNDIVYLKIHYFLCY